MPASRKRNKGKDRKAKQLAKKVEKDRADTRMMWQSYYSYKSCNHGRILVISNDHPVSNFIDLFFMNLEQNKTLEQHLRDIFKSHQIWKNEIYMKLIKDTLVRIGTNMMLDEYFTIEWPLCIAQAIIALEHYNGTDEIDLDKHVVVSKWRDLARSGSSRRDVLKCFRKRTSCKCLKRLHLDARKSTPKIGICLGCREEKERSLLSVCSKCMISQYCSRDCQVADWAHHEKACNDYAHSAHHQHSSEG